MSKGLEKLNELKDVSIGTRYDAIKNACEIVTIEEVYKEHFDIIYKELKALEIIKRKKVNVVLLLHLIHYNSRPRQKYNEVMLGEWNDLHLLTQDEFDLLKEVLL